MHDLRKSKAWMIESCVRDVSRATFVVGEFVHRFENFVTLVFKIALVRYLNGLVGYYLIEKHSFILVNRE